MNDLADNTTVDAVSDAGTYYLNVFALSQKEEVTLAEEQVEPEVPLSPTLSPLVVYAPFFLFFALFIGAFGIQVITRSWNMRRTVMAFIIALFAASVPFVLTSVRDGVGVGAKAGPDDIPRNVRVVKGTDESALVVWQTGGARVGAVRFGPAPIDEKTRDIAIGDLGNIVTIHTVKLDPLKAGQTYEFEILSGTSWYDDNGKPLRFRTVR
jgi:hypothetical protein